MASDSALADYAGLPPANSNAGFLPPEYGTGRGMGYVKYTVMPKDGLPTGTELRNVANFTSDFIETIAPIINPNSKPGPEKFSALLRFSCDFPWPGKETL